MGKVHDTKIWDRIVEAYKGIGVKGNPTAIAKELGMAQPSVREWKEGTSTPKTATLRQIARSTGYASNYLADGTLPKQPGLMADDLHTAELLTAWELLDEVNRGRLLERAAELLARQIPHDADSESLQRG